MENSLSFIGFSEVFYNTEIVNITFKDRENNFKRSYSSMKKIFMKIEISRGNSINGNEKLSKINSHFRCELMESIENDEVKETHEVCFAITMHLFGEVGK